MTADVERRATPYPVALAAVLWTVGMLFAAFTAALLVRRGSSDWQPVSLPPIIWANTAALFLSSLAIERGRRAWVSGGPLSLERALRIGSLFGVLFLAGQIWAWRQLVVDGVLLSTGAHPAFFYMLSGIHGVHVLGGLGALAWASRKAPAASPGWRPVKYVAMYWHFVGVVWLWVLAALLIS